MPYITYADIESLIRKIDGCANNPEKSLKVIIGEHIPCGYSMSTIAGFDHIESKHTLYRGKDILFVIFAKEKSLKSLLNKKITEKSEIFVITRVNIEVQHIVFVT